MAITKIPAAGFTGNNFRNIIINGDMSIAQRGTSATGLTAGTENYNTVDRWQTGIFTTSAVFTQTQSTDVPSGQGFAKSLKMDCTTADASLASAVQMFLRYKIEGQNLQYLNYANANAKSLTLSFWVKSNKTGTYIAEILRSGRTINKSYTIDSASTWEKKTITFEGDTGGSAISNNNSAGFSILFFLGNGSNMTSGTLQTSWGTYTDANRAVGQVNLADSTSNEWFITGVQLEAGTTASDFEFLPYDVNYLRCARYCWRPMYEYSAVKYLHSQGGYKDANYVAFHVVPPVPMRTTPSVTEIGNVDIWSQNGFYTGWTWGFIMGIHSGAEWYVSANKTSHGIADANMPYAVINTQANGWLEYNAEL